MAEELFGGQDVGATPSYKEQAYRLIKEAILFNRFRVGAIYSQDDICKELGISRTPVREALLELAAMGLVEERPYSGTFVRHLKASDIEDIYNTRAFLDEYAARQAARLATQEQLDAYSDYKDTYGQNYCTMVALMDAVTSTLTSGAVVS